VVHYVAILYDISTCVENVESNYLMYLNGAY